MATTFTATRAATTAPAFQPSGSGILCAAYGTIEVAANPTAGDTYNMCRLPAGAVVLAGRIYSDDLDTNATETLDLDVGWAANGVEAADTDGFGNLGVLGTDTVAGVKPEAGYNYALGGLLVTDGPVAFTAETVVTVTCVATAATFAAGTLSVVVYYVVP
jgi:hypothetical protein